ncbi:MAG: GHKL domain-containing protein, partial [Chitinophagaceae bacterium]
LPPMLLIPIIENAFKHHSDTYSNAGINIDIHVNSNKLIIKCDNAYNPDAQRTRSSGLGLETLRRRLKLIYGTACALDISKSNSIFSVILVIPLSTEAAINAAETNTLYNQI